METKLVPALINAVMNNQVTKVSWLLKRGANPNGCEDKLLYSPLHYAAAHCSAEVALLLIKAGANLEAKDSDGNTPLDAALLHNNQAFIALFEKPNRNSQLIEIEVDNENKK